MELAVVISQFQESFLIAKKWYSSWITHKRWRMRLQSFWQETRNFMHISRNIQRVSSTTPQQKSNINKEKGRRLDHKVIGNVLFLVNLAISGDGPLNSHNLIIGTSFQLRREERILTFSSSGQNMHATVINCMVINNIYLVRSEWHTTLKLYFFVGDQITRRQPETDIHKEPKLLQVNELTCQYQNLTWWYHRLPDNIYNFLLYRPGGELKRNSIHVRKFTCHYQAFNLSEIWQIDP